MARTKSEVDRILEENKVMGSLRGGPVTLPGESSQAAHDKELIGLLVKTIKDLRKYIEDLEKRKGVSTASSVEPIVASMMDMYADLRRQLAEKDRMIEGLMARIDELIIELRDHKRLRYGSDSHKSKKGNGKKGGDGGDGGGESRPDRCEQRDEYDGSGAPKDGDAGEGGRDDAKPKEAKKGGNPVPENVNKEKVKSEFLDTPRGKRGQYRTMDAAKSIYHANSGLIPPGCKLVKYVERREYDKVSYIVEHVYNCAIVVDENGVEHEIFNPADPDDARRPHTIPGTHSTPELLADLVINQYLLFVPNERIAPKLHIDGLTSSSNTWNNWKRKGAKLLEPILKMLKKKLLHTGAYLHIDETWCKVRIKFKRDGSKLGKYFKKYVWVLVNKKTKVVYFLYDNDENDSRAFRPINTFLGDAPVDIGSDAYSVYYHLAQLKPECAVLLCWAHVRAKFWTSLNVAKDAEAQWFLDMIGFLYRVEAECRMKGLSEAAVRDRRQMRDVQKTLQEIKNKAESMVAAMEKGAVKFSSKLYKALKYMLNGWDHLTTYTTDGKYDIDNCLAEQKVRAFCLGRKNSEHFGSEDGVRTACVYYTIVSTLREWKIDVKQYLVDFFTECIKGINDYAPFDPEVYSVAHS